MKRWGVVGGGMLGLTIAHRLAQAGHHVTILEAAPKLGGLASAWTVGDVTWDRFYHVVMLSDQRLRRLLDELGLDAGIDWKVTRAGFFTGKGLYQLNNAVDYLRFPALNLFDKFRLGLTILYMARISDGRRLEAIPLEDWLTRLSGRRVFENIWRPLLAAKLGENYKKASASFIWSYARRFYAARQGGMKTEMFGYVPGGYARVLERFVALLVSEGTSIRTSCPVDRIGRTADGTFAVSHGEEKLVFDRLVVTTAAPLAAEICEDLTRDERCRLRNVTYNGVICASVVLTRPLGGYYLTYITDRDIPFTAVIEMSSLVDAQKYLGGKTLAYLPRYVTGDDAFWSLSDGEIGQRFLAGLRKIYPDVTDDQVLALRIARARQVYAVSTLNYSDNLPPTVTSVPGLTIVNSAHIVNASLAVNETVTLAEQTVAKMLEQEAGDCEAIRLPSRRPTDYGNASSNSSCVSGMPGNSLVPLAGDIFQDALTLLAISNIPTATAKGIFQTFWRKRSDKARDILLTQLRQCKVSEVEAADRDHLIDVLYRYAVAVRDNVATRNLHLLAQAIKGLLNRHDLYADDFHKYAKALSELTRDEIIVLGALHISKQDVREKLQREPTISEYWDVCVSRLVPSMYSSDLQVLAVVCGSLRSGLVVSGLDIDSGGMFGTSPFMDEVFNLVQFQEALREQD